MPGKPPAWQPRMAPAPTMWPSEVPASSQVRPKDSTISSCGVPPASDLPWIDMVQMMRMLENITAEGEGAKGGSAD